MRIESKIKFVGLHAHSVAGSIFDALGYPNEHMDFAYENGCDALALTDHGNMNGLSYQVLHAKTMKKEGRTFKPIFGCEAYFIPSLDEWREEYTKAMSDKKSAKGAKKDDASASTVEDEESSKKGQDILRRRRHLVLLAQNQTGLNNLFKLITESYKPDNFYRYPRIDLKLLKQYNEGIIGASACLTGDSVLDTSEGTLSLLEVVERVKSGEELFVLSYDEKQERIIHQKILWADKTRKNAELVKIRLKDGRQLRLTPDHKVFTDKGWMEACSLKEHKGIKILCLKEE